MTERQPVLGVIGGSGLYKMAALTDIEEVAVETPFGAPSDVILRGRIHGTTVLFLPRHGRSHGVPPSAINGRANIWALKKLGATHVVSVSAVGSLREEIVPGHLVVVSQFIDRTTQRTGTFFERDVAVHVPTADPVCPIMAAAITKGARATGSETHVDKTYVCIEGPRFSTRAESHMFRAWGADVIGMTNVPEAFLAREAELPYATLALSTDYDCWRPHEEGVDVAAVVAVLHKNVQHAQSVIASIARDMPDVSASPAQGALRGALMTNWATVPEAAKARLALLLDGRV